MFLYMTTVQTLLELMKEICQCDFLDFKQDVFVNSQKVSCENFILWTHWGKKRTFCRG